MSMCLTLGVTLLNPTAEIQLKPVCSDRDSVYLRITLVLLTYLYVNIIYPSVDSESIAG